MSFINKPLFKLERKSNLISLLVFSLVAGALCFLTIALFPVLQNILNELALEAKGTGFEEFLKMDNIADYFTSNMFQMWGLLGLVFASFTAAKLTSGNFKNGSYEMVYTLNISRGKIVKTKLVRLLLNLTYFTVVCGVFTYVGLVIFAGVKTFSTLNFLIYMLLTWAITLIVGVLAFSLGLISKRKFGTQSALFLAILLYIVVVIQQTAMTDWIGYFSPLSPLISNVIGEGFGALANTWPIILVWAVFAPVLLIISIIKFKNDDLC